MIFFIRTLGEEERHIFLKCLNKFDPCIKGTVMQNEKAPINGRSCVSKVS